MKTITFNNHQVILDVNDQELKRLPKKEPFIIVSNQLLDGMDEAVLLEVFKDFSTDFKIVTPKKSKDDFHLSTGSKLQPNYVTKLFKTLKKAQNKNISTGILLNFEGGRLENPGKRELLNRTFKVIRKLKIPIVPIRLNSDVHPFFQSGLRARLLKRTQQKPIKITVRIGKPVDIELQHKFQKNSQFRKFIQSKIFALGSSLEVKNFFPNLFYKKTEKQEEIAAAIPQDLIEKEIQALTFDDLIASQSNFDIFVADAKNIPNTLLEIGRLREITFREVGEGTGKSRDVDEFDIYYQQLIIWDRKAKRIVGGYRLGKGAEIFERYGVDGFYVSSFFKIEEAFWPVMQNAIELGRSYIVSDYQKQRWPLFLLWKGILFFLLKNPQYRYLYGPVSISKYYSNVSKSLIVAFIKKFYFNQELGQYLTPRKPFKFKTKKVDIDILLQNMDNHTKSLDTLVEDIEPNHFRMPVLIRQYLKLNARFISFNVDPNFSDCLDGFIILDLKDVPYSMIEALKKEV